MPPKQQIAIIGLGLIGTSAGLALRRYRDRIEVVGHDKELSRAAQAKKLGAVDRTEWNLINAVSKADRILLALPVNELKATLEAMAQDLKPGCVILDTADVKGQILPWAASLLPEHVQIVGGHPILVTEDADASAARADLFEGKIFCLTPDSHTDQDAVRLATDLVESLGAQAFFLDPDEHDGLVAAIEHLPRMLAGALAGTTTGSQGWKEMRKVAGNQFYSTSLVMEEDGAAAASACVANRENTLRWLDRFTAELAQWRGFLEAGDEEALAAAFASGLQERSRWLYQQESGDWSETKKMEIPTAGSQFRRLLGLGGRSDAAGKKGR